MGLLGAHRGQPRAQTRHFPLPPQPLQCQQQRAGGSARPHGPIERRARQRRRHTMSCTHSAALPTLARRLPHNSCRCHHASACSAGRRRWHTSRCISGILLRWSGTEAGSHVQGTPGSSSCRTARARRGRWHRRFQQLAGRPRTRPQTCAEAEAGTVAKAGAKGKGGRGSSTSAVNTAHRCSPVFAEVLGASAALVVCGALRLSRKVAPSA